MNRILIVIDYQNDFVTGALGSAEAAAIKGAVLEKVKNFRGEVIFTKDTHGADYLETQEGKNLPVPHCMEGGEGWMLVPELEGLARERGSKIYCKNTFGSVELAQALAGRNLEEKIGEIELIGVCTDICVISNAMLLKAFMPEVPIKVVAGCCAGVTPEGHKNALDAMRACQIQIT